jgi:hypothetical protein
MPIESVYNELEKQADKLKWFHQISDLIAQEFKKLEESGDPDASDEQIKRSLNWEYNLFRFATKTEYAKPEKGRRFYPMATGTNQDGTAFETPDIKWFDEESLEYFKERIGKTKSNVLLARYSDFLWEQTKEKQYADLAYDSYMSCVDLDFKQEEFFRVADSLDRCLHLIMIGVIDDSKLDKLKTKLYEVCEDYIAQTKPRFIIEPIRSLLESKQKYLDDGDYAKIQQMIHKAREYFKVNKNSHLERSMIELESALDKYFGIGNSDAGWKNELALSHEEEANNQYKKGEFLSASFFYQDALDMYQKAGNSAKINEIKNKIIDSNKKALPQFQEISAEVKFKDEDIVAVVEPVIKDSAEDTLKAFAKFGGLIPRFDSAKKLAEDMSKKFVFMHLARTTTINDRGHIVSSDDSHERETYQNYLRSIEFTSGVFIKRVLDVLKTKGWTVEMVVQHLSESEAFAEDNLKFIRHALQRFFENDYVSFIHIAVPQLEDAIRRILSLNNIQTISLSENGTKDKTLTDLFQTPAVREHIFRDILWHYYDTVLLNHRGWNLRNEIAHGILPYEKASATTATTVLHLLLLLTNFKRREASNIDEASKRVKQ